LGLLSKTAAEISLLLTRTVRDKLKSYQPETGYMPFHHGLLGRDRYAMFSFIQSINTTFGMSIWEQIAAILARACGDYAERQHKLLGEINEEAEQRINELHYMLRKGEAIADKVYETAQIRETIRPGQPTVHPDSTVDLFVKRNGEEDYFDITTAKPNMKEFVTLKLKLLRWTALRLSQDSSVNVTARLAIPYNPYHPEPYERWTLRGLYDLEKGEILVGAEFWDYVARDSIYEGLVDVFRSVGEELRGEIDEKFASFRSTKESH
jgi:hypothetical protein